MSDPILTQTIAPTLEPLTLADVAAALRLDSNEILPQAAYLDGLIMAARTFVEDVTTRQLLTATWEARLDWFPGVVKLKKCPVRAVSSITYFDTANVQRTLPITTYQVDVQSEPARIIPVYNQIWPYTYSRLQAVTVTFTAGYGDTIDTVPASLKHAMLLLIGHWYEHREAVNVGNIGTPFPFAVEALMTPYRFIEV